MVDVLSFVDVLLHDNIRSRQLAVNGVRLDELVGASTSTLLAEGVSFEHQRTYLETLQGGPDLLGLNEGRSAVGFCDYCLDNDGWILAATIVMESEKVVWARVGVDLENGFPLVKEGPWWRRQQRLAPPDWQWWIEQERHEELSFTFERSEYEVALQAELDRIKGIK